MYGVTAGAALRHGSQKVLEFPKWQHTMSQSAFARRMEERYSKVLQFLGYPQSGRLLNVIDLVFIVPWPLSGCRMFL